MRYASADLPTDDEELQQVSKLNAFTNERKFGSNRVHLVAPKLSSEKEIRTT